MSFWSGNDLARLTHGQERLRETADDYPGSFAEQMCLWDLHNYLPDDILVKVDRATMAVSIEGREPLLDHRIAEFAFRLPLHLRRGSLGPKHILRKILYNYVPRAIVDRPKMGFGIPLLEWLRGDMNHLIGDYLDPVTIKAQGLLDPDVVARAVETFQRGDDYAQGRVWTLLAFQMWRDYNLGEPSIELAVRQRISSQLQLAAHPRLHAARQRRNSAQRVEVSTPRR